MKKGIVALTLLFAAPAFGGDAQEHESEAKDCMAKKDFEGASKAWGDAISAYFRSGAREQACRTALDAFSALAEAGRPDLAAPFVTEALDAMKGDLFPKSKARLGDALGGTLEALYGKEAFKEGARLLEAAIDGLERKKVFPTGLSEGHFRRSLDLFLLGAKEYHLAVANGEALAALGKRLEYPYWEAVGLLGAGRASCLAGKHAEALGQLAGCQKKARTIGDSIREGYAHIWTGETHCALKKYDEAEKAVARAERVFGSIRDRKGKADARNLGLKIARAMQDEEKIRSYDNSASASGGAGGAGGAGGDANIMMEAVEFCRKAFEQEKDVPVMQIYRKGNHLVFRNLFTRSEITKRIEYKFHYESVFGVHFQLRGPELQFLKVAPNEGLPGVPGGSTTTINGELHVQGPELDPFRVRHFAGRGGSVMLTSSGHTYWKRR